MGEVGRETCETWFADVFDSVGTCLAESVEPHDDAAELPGASEEVVQLLLRRVEGEVPHVERARAEDCVGPALLTALALAVGVERLDGGVAVEVRHRGQRASAQPRGAVRETPREEAPHTHTHTHTPCGSRSIGTPPISLRIYSGTTLLHWVQDCVGGERNFFSPDSRCRAELGPCELVQAHQQTACPSPRTCSHYSL